jgi:hypothetical protein
MISKDRAQKRTRATANQLIALPEEELLPLLPTHVAAVAVPEHNTAATRDKPLDPDAVATVSGAASAVLLRLVPYEMWSEQ